MAGRWRISLETPERHRADEWAVALAAGCIPRRLRLRLDGWALIIATNDVEAAREALHAFDQENIVNSTDVSVDAVAPVRGAAAVGVVVGLLLIGFFPPPALAQHPVPGSRLE